MTSQLFGGRDGTDVQPQARSLSSLLTSKFKCDMPCEGR